MKALDSILGMALTFMVFSLFFLKQELRTPELSLFIFSLIIGLVVNKFLISKTSSSCKQTEAE